MSSQTAVEQQLIDQTRQQIRGLVSEIAQLAKSDCTPLEFYTEFLSRVVTALAAEGGAVWVTGNEGMLELQYQINLIQTQLAANQENQQRHGRLLHKVMQSGEGTIIQPRSGAADNDEAANLTDYLLVLGPLKNDKQTQGVVEIFQRPNSAPQAQKGYLRFVLQMCELASDFLKTRSLRDFGDRQAVWLQLEGFTRAAHASLDPRSTAYVIANEGRRLIDCDRVSVAIKRGRKCTIEAVSGQDLFDKRSNTVTMLNRLATAVVATGEPVWYTGDTSDMPPQVEEAVQDYVDESHSKMVAILPLKKPLPAAKPDDKDQPREQETIGALIVEQIESRRLGEGLLQRVDVVTDHSSSALTNALEYNSLFLMPVWRTLGKSTWVVKGRTLPKTITISLILLAAIIALIVVPGDFDLKGDGTLQPELRRDVFAQIPGVVEDIPVQQGQLVPRDAVLVQMRNEELADEEIKLIGERNSNYEQLRSVERALLESQGTLTTSDVIRLRGDQKKLEATVASIDQQLAILEEKKKHLRLYSPIDGQVVTWDMVDLLKFRPVERGQLLVSVVDPAGDWELEVLVPEDRMGHITKAQLEMQKDLPVRYVLATTPDTEYEGHVKEVHYAAEVRGEEGNTVLMRVSLDPRQLIGLHAHMQKNFALNTAGLNVLVADDNSEGRRTLKETLEGLGHKVTVAENAEAAMSQAAAAKFDLMLIQMGMPGTDGLQATQLLRERELQSGTRLPVVGVLPATMKYDRERFMAAGLDGHLRQPVDKNTLQAQLDHTMLKELVAQKMVSGELSTEKFTELTGLRPGATVRAKIHCGTRSLGYVWLHDVVAFVQRTWFSLF